MIVFVIVNVMHRQAGFLPNHSTHYAYISVPLSYFIFETTGKSYTWLPGYSAFPHWMVFSSQRVGVLSCKLNVVIGPFSGSITSIPIFQINRVCPAKKWILHAVQRMCLSVFGRFRRFYGQHVGVVVWIVVYPFPPPSFSHPFSPFFSVSLFYWGRPLPFIHTDF